jgi:hypothetical protein
MPDNWINWFEITGAAGAQLIGLLFVVVTLGIRLSILAACCFRRWSC